MPSRYEHWPFLCVWLTDSSACNSEWIILCKSNDIRFGSRSRCSNIVGELIRFPSYLSGVSIIRRTWETKKHNVWCSASHYSTLHTQTWWCWRQWYFWHSGTGSGRIPYALLVNLNREILGWPNLCDRIACSCDSICLKGVRSRSHQMKNFYPIKENSHLVWHSSSQGEMEIH